MRIIAILILLISVILLTSCSVDETFEGIVDGIEISLLGTRVYFHDGSQVFFQSKPDIVIGDKYKVIVNDKRLISFIHLEKPELIKPYP